MKKAISRKKDLHMVLCTYTTVENKKRYNCMKSKAKKAVYKHCERRLKKGLLS